jgi:hypothetical protein
MPIRSLVEPNAMIIDGTMDSTRKHPFPTQPTEPKIYGKLFNTT